MTPLETWAHHHARTLGPHRMAENLPSAPVVESGLTRPISLPTIWSDRTLDPPDLPTDLAIATRCRTRTTVVLTDDHPAREHPLVPTSALHFLTVHDPGNTPSRPISSYHHLSPHPASTDVTRAVLDLLAHQP